MALQTDFTIQERLLALIVTALIGFGISWVASRFGYFKLPHDSREGDLTENKQSLFLSVRHVVFAFGIFLAVEIVIAPALFILWKSIMEEKVIAGETIHLTKVEQGWLNMFAVMLNFFGILYYVFALSDNTRALVWGKGIGCSKFLPFKNYLVGVGSWFIVYPWLMALSQLVGILLTLGVKGPHIDQVAVKHVKDVMDHPVLLWVSVASIALLVPVVEEVLFRGFLQGWLKIHYGTVKAILFTSAIFAFFHYSAAQKVENVELLALLFVLSCFLGFVRERQNSLWASIGLHSTFNLLSLQLIIAETR